MSNVNRKFESVIRSVQTKLYNQDKILPIRVKDGILVGKVLICYKDNLKDLYKNDQLVFSGVFLNIAAIKIANLLTKNDYSSLAERIYSADQTYGKHYNDSKMLGHFYEKYKKSKDFDKSDIFYARYEISKSKALEAKTQVEKLIYL